MASTIFFQSAGSCCQSSCQYFTLGHRCRAEDECRSAVECSGTSALCPDNDSRFYKPDQTVCAGGALLCLNGSCSLSICALHSLLPCQLKTHDDSLCMVACLRMDGSCIPFQAINRNSSFLSPLYVPCKIVLKRKLFFKFSSTIFRWFTVQ